MLLRIRNQLIEHSFPFGVNLGLVRRAPCWRRNIATLFAAPIAAGFEIRLSRIRVDYTDVLQEDNN